MAFCPECCLDAWASLPSLLVKGAPRQRCATAPTQHPAVPVPLLQAFVGYRDWGIEAGDGQYVVQDFVDSSEAYRLHSLLTMVRACGGGNAEDVAGGLKVRE